MAWTTVAALLFAAFTSVTTLSAAPASADPASPVVTFGTTTAQLACQELLVVGARGSGEAGPGGTDAGGTDENEGLGARVHAVAAGIVSRIPDHRSIGIVALSYAADDVSVLLTHAASAAYVRDLVGGKESMLRYLRGRATTCPFEQITLVGYSQGAMIVHRVLNAVTATGAPGPDTDIAGRVISAVLVGDGDRVSTENSTTLGSAPRRNGIGVQFSRITLASRTPLATGMASRTVSVCIRGDVICDFRVPAACAALGFTRAGLACAAAYEAPGVAIHLSYQRTPLLELGAQNAADAVLRTPSPVSGSFRIHAVVGRALHTRLQVRVGSDYTVAWSKATPQTFPSGLTLSSAGDVRGVITRTGTSTTTVQVIAAILGVSSPPVRIRLTVTSTSATSVTDRWTATPTPTPPDLSPGESPVAGAVNCSGVGECTALIGYHGGEDSRWTRGFARLRSGAWTYEAAQLPSDAAEEPQVEIDDGGEPIVCGLTLCAVAGRYTRAHDHTAVVWVFRGRDPALVASLPVPDEGSAEYLTVDRLSCELDDSCLALGSFDTSDGHHRRTVAWVLTGTTWRAVPFPTTETGPAPYEPHLACRSVDDRCVVAGYSGTAERVWTYQDGGVSVMELPVPTGARPVGLLVPDHGCRPTFGCVIGGRWQDRAGAEHPAVWIYADGFQRTDLADPPDETTAMRSGSCSSAMCVFEGYWSGQGASGTQVWFSRDGRSWPSFAPAVDARSVDVDWIGCGLNQCAVTGVAAGADHRQLVWVWSGGALAVRNLPSPVATKDTTRVVSQLSCADAGACFLIGLVRVDGVFVAAAWQLDTTKVVASALPHHPVAGARTSEYPLHLACGMRCVASAAFGVPNPAPTATMLWAQP